MRGSTPSWWNCSVHCARINGRIRTTAHRLIAEGDYVVVEARGSNMTKGGLLYNNNYCFVFRSDNRLKEVTEYFDTELVTAALGQPEGDL
jgi:ketosteroid isomerase-like protein